MQTAGSATNEFTARIGMIGGMFTKRVLMLFWALAGLIAIGLYAGRLHDPDLIWGVMTRDLLPPGAIGLMLVGVLAANMSTLDASAVSHAALFIRNLYTPLVPGRSDKHYLLVGRLVIAVTLAGAILVAMTAENLLELFQYIISVPAIFGASIWLGFVWRRVTKWAVVWQVAICILLYAAIPTAFQSIDAARRHPAWLLETAPRQVSSTAPATRRRRGGRPGLARRRPRRPVADRAAHRRSSSRRSCPRIPAARIRARKAAGASTPSCG